MWNYWPPLEGSSSVVSSSLFQSSKSSIFSSKFRKKHQSENFEKMNYFQDTSKSIHGLGRRCTSHRNNGKRQIRKLCILNLHFIFKSQLEMQNEITKANSQFRFLTKSLVVVVWKSFFFLLPIILKIAKLLTMNSIRDFMVHLHTYIHFDVKFQFE